MSAQHLRLGSFQGVLRKIRLFPFSPHPHKHTHVQRHTKRQSISCSKYNVVTKRKYGSKMVEQEKGLWHVLCSLNCLVHPFLSAGPPPLTPPRPPPWDPTLPGFMRKNAKKSDLFLTHVCGMSEEEMGLMMPHNSRWNVTIVGKINFPVSLSRKTLIFHLLRQLFSSKKNCLLDETAWIWPFPPFLLLHRATWSPRPSPSVISPRGKISV